MAKVLFVAFEFDDPVGFETSFDFWFIFVAYEFEDPIGVAESPLNQQIACLAEDLS